MKHALLLGTLLALAGVGADADELKGCAVSGDARQIAGLFEQWNKSLATGSPDAVADNYAADAILLPTVSNRVRHSREEIKDYFAHFLEKKPKGSVLECNIRRVGNVAINSGVYRFDLDDHGHPQQVVARYTYVYKKVGGKWLIAEHHSSAMPEKF
jgi:uncharacterized protein (TIGR02246 family)